VQAGDLVREIEKDPDWVLYGGTTGVILRPADEDVTSTLGATSQRHWWVLWGNGFTHMMWDRHIEVISASR
tara:strand:+ start:1124 stop:1336 length:213 start_codon:yes stop_codon:yes gene_type:complete